MQDYVTERTACLIALSCNHKNHQRTVPDNDYGSYTGSNAMLLIRSHATRIKMQSVLSKMKNISLLRSAAIIMIVIAMMEHGSLQARVIGVVTSVICKIP